MENTWGWNPDSFQAIGTVAAFGVGLFALLVTLRQQRMLQADAQLRYARLVDAQLLEDDESPISSHHRQYTIAITNAGPLPVHNVKPVIGGVWIRFRDLTSSLFGPGIAADVGSTQALLPFGWWGLLWKSTAMKDLGWGSLAPGREVTVTMLLDTSAVHWRKDHIGVAFTDADGLRWTKRLDGSLRGGNAVFGPRR